MSYTHTGVETLWKNLVEYGIATEEELQLITGINGYNKEALEDVLYYRTGFNSWEQFKGEDEEEEEEEEENEGED